MAFNSLTIGSKHDTLRVVCEKFNSFLKKLFHYFIIERSDYICGDSLLYPYTL